MSNARAAHRYAKALLDLAVERNELDRVQQDLNDVKASIRESREFRNLLASPVIKPHQKVQVLKAIFESSLSNTTNMFLALLVDHGREGITAEVIDSFHTGYLKVKGITHATVTSSTPLSAELRNKFTLLVKEMTGNEVELEEKVNAEIIGGFVLRVGDKQIDTSVAGQLHELKQQYKDNLYVADY
ncbi:ATP synthase F1 subunit delta [Phaeocystidibacter luteus]|uniref:ATP synthase subunit delta n=1 Tax=Phaeocystidibacter luteus TaxID=911197 RepID=A0A6N6RG00_9FLAO|nr:ATP synthase F1 subunit delta [Phaeocystidibacter luteus]KAB2810114.1 ATP synthase F1 subunit delta [Phaeocystidibacter luteus]